MLFNFIQEVERVINSSILSVIADNIVTTVVLL